MDITNKAVIVISSHVVRGSVGNRATVFALETLGFPVWALPTVVLPWHPGHGPSHRMTFSESDFDKAMDDLIRAPWLREVKAVLTGYFGNASQPRAVARLIRVLKEQNPDLLYVCDPVIGDFGGLYVPRQTAEAIRDELLPLATIATPNRYELAWLTQRELDSNAAMADAALQLGPSGVLVTSAMAMMARGTGNLYVTGKKVILAEHRMIEKPPNGLGDLLGALFLGRLLGGMETEKALETATASVIEILVNTAKLNRDELMLESGSASITAPIARVQMRRLLHPAHKYSQ